MTVPDEAVEAAARRAWLDSVAGRRSCESWDALDPLEQATYRLYATDILTAAAPFIAAQAWEEGMRAGKSRAMRHMSDEPGLSLNIPNPYRSEQ